MKDKDKIEKAILNYFKLVNPLPYDEVKIDMRLSNILAVVEIKIYAEDTASYTSKRRRERSVVEKIKRDMNDMFPYTFQVYSVFNLPINNKFKKNITSSRS